MAAFVRSKGPRGCPRLQGPVAAGGHVREKPLNPGEEKRKEKSGGHFGSVGMFSWSFIKLFLRLSSSCGDFRIDGMKNKINILK